MTKMLNVWTLECNTLELLEMKKRTHKLIMYESPQTLKEYLPKMSLRKTNKNKHILTYYWLHYLTFSGVVELKILQKSNFKHKKC